MVDRHLTKLERLHHICYLLYRNPRGLTVRELAHRCGVQPRSIQRDLASLEEEGVPLGSDEGYPPRYTIIEGYYIPPVRLTIDDAVALYLASRLLARYADTYDPHIADALAKLSTILPEGMAGHVHRSAAALERREHDDRFVTILRVLAVGWDSGRKVRIQYLRAGGKHVRECLISPYLLEPAAAGNATYVVGETDYCQGLRTFKVERIQSAVLTDELFEIPADFDGPGLFAGAWSIWVDEQPEDVVLRFLPQAVRRVKETHWHPSQSLRDLSDGGCELRLTIDEPREMIHWVRGWGPLAEVIEPKWMREQLAREATQVVDMYATEA